MKTIVALFLACFATALLGQAPPVTRSPWTTNVFPQNGRAFTPTFISPSIVTTNVGTGGVTTVSGTQFKHTLTFSQPTELHPGDEIALFPSLSQYNIAKRTDSTHYEIVENLQGSLAAVFFDIYTNAAYITDINGLPASAIGADGSYLIYGFGNGGNSGKLIFVNSINGSNNVHMELNSLPSVYGSGPCVQIYNNSSSASAGPAWFASLKAPDYCTGVQEDGHLMARWGFSNNAFSSLMGNVGIGIPYSSTISLTVSNNSANTISVFSGNIADYAQIKLKNFNTAAGASGDFVVEAGHGTETNHYVDLGINGPNGGGQPFTNGGYAYLYSQPSNNQPHVLNIGALGSNSAIAFYAGSPVVGASGSVTNPVERMRLNTNGSVGIGTVGPVSALDVPATGTFGTLKATNVSGLIASVTTNTVLNVLGSGSGSTNYVFTAFTNSVNDWITGSSNMLLASISGGVAGAVIPFRLAVTNLSGNTWGIVFSAGTNRWKFTGLTSNTTNAPSVLTNNTRLIIEGRLEGTNTSAKWYYETPAL